MKVLISTDIEGVAGVVHPEQTTPGNPEYERARVWMAHEANAAIAGAFDAGATEVLVNDSHGSFRNMPPDLLDARAQAVIGKPRYLGMMAGVETGVNAVCLIGYHSRAQGLGILAHTINGFAFARVYVNDVECGEAAIYGALAGEFNVPIAMASGDDVFIEETRPSMPHTTFVQTKRATGHTSGVSLSPEQARQAIRIGVATGLRQIAKISALEVAAPIVVRIQTHSPAFADLFCQWPTLERRAGNEVIFQAPTVQAAVRMINSLSTMTAFLR